MEARDTRKLIAVVDDEPPVRKALARALRLEDYEVATYASGAEFLASVAAQPPSCAVVDIHMPGISGLEVARSVRDLGLPFRVVLISASNEPDVLREAEAVGAARLLLKPFSIDLLCSVIESATVP